jgi:hypothetical protein
MGHQDRAKMFAQIHASALMAFGGAEVPHVVIPLHQDEAVLGQLQRCRKAFRDLFIQNKDFDFPNDSRAHQRRWEKSLFNPRGVKATSLTYACGLDDKTLFLPVRGNQFFGKLIAMVIEGKHLF